MERLHTSKLQLFVDRLVVRSVLTDEEKEAILDLPGQAVTLRRGHDFVRINEETTSSCLIVSGMVGRFGQTSNGLRQFTAFHLPGDMADLHSAVRPIGAGGLNALSDTTILRVTHTAIRAVAARYSAVAEAFWRDCMLDAAILTQWAVNVGRRDARTRLAHIICEMAIRSSNNREALQNYAFPVTQEQLGDAAALTSIHVNRSLKALREGGFATVGRGSVQIHDWKGLVSRGEFDPAYLIADTGPERQQRLLSGE